MSEVNYSAKWYKVEEFSYAPEGMYWLYENREFLPTFWYIDCSNGEKTIEPHDQSSFYCEEDLRDRFSKDLRFYGPIFPPEYPKE